MRYFFVLIIVLLLQSCKKTTSADISVHEYHKTMDKITSIIVHDVFSPPVASRIYCYSSLAGYEVLRNENTKYQSFAGFLKDMPKIQKPNSTQKIDFKMASIIAMSSMGKKLIFSEKEMQKFQDSLFGIWEDNDKEVFNNSKMYADSVVSQLSKWMKKDNYAQTRTMPKYTVIPHEEGRWQPTPPSYMAAIEPHWSKMRTWLIDSSAQFKPQKPTPFSKDLNSQFMKEAKAVMEAGNLVRKKGNQCDSMNVAKFWDCNPYVTVQQGHMMFATKKITPGGHWINICKIACLQSKADIMKTSYAYVRVSLALADGFISCWDEKYRSNVIRPETVINKYLDPAWKPLLQTPPFPEYTSGHSVVSGATSTVLTKVFGNNFSFNDTSEIPFGLPARKFKSFNHAADEAAISRFYGGIHYMPAIINGVEQGRNIGKLQNLKLKGIVK